MSSKYALSGFIYTTLKINQFVLDPKESGLDINSAGHKEKQFSGVTFWKSVKYDLLT